MGFTAGVMGLGMVGAPELPSMACPPPQSEVCPPPAPLNEFFGKCIWTNGIKKIVNDASFFLKNCTFVHITDQILPITGPRSETPTPTDHP